LMRHSEGQGGRSNWTGRSAMRLLIAAVALPLAFDVSAEGPGAQPPVRVVSMNVCTDQLAMLLAAPGQLVSISHIAADPGSSALAAEAGHYRLNYGLAEDIFLMKPDLVVTGTFSTTATAPMLQRLGVRVERFPPDTSFDVARQNIRRMGILLGQEGRAEEMVAALDEGLRLL